jgi:uridine phosphorylase
MESATLFIVCQILGARSGCVLNVVWNQEREKAGLSNPHCHDTELAIKTAVEAVRILIKRG